MSVDDARDAPAADLWFGVLGPLRAWVRGREMALGPRKQQVVLATLLCSPNRYVSLDCLFEAVWDQSPPRTARKNLHVYVCNLRALLRDAGARDCIFQRDHGYVISVGPDELDSLAFENLFRTGTRLSTAAGDPAAVGIIRRALDLWSGPPFEGLEAVPVITAAAELLSRRYVSAFETWAEAAMTTDPGAVADQIEEVIRTDPFRERLRLIQMTALHRQGRPAEALAVFDDYRQAMAREFGLAPGTAMVRLHDLLLLDSPAPPTAPRPPHSLPRRPGHLTGRAADAAELAAELRDRGASVAVITGPVGAGKTVLATTCAYELSESYPDGQLFAGFRDADGEPKTVDTVLRELIADALGAVPGGSPDRLHGVWQSWLAAHRALIVLDDMPDEAAAERLLPRVGGSAALITSRVRLPALTQAYRLELASLPVGEALELFARHVGLDRVAADPAAAERIVRLTGLLPLGIVTAGGKLASLRHVPLREYADRLGRAPSVLDELRVGALAVRTRLASAVRDLPGPARSAFVQLGRLRQPVFTLAQASAVLGVDAPDAGITLEHLIEANIVTAPETEISAHEVVYALPDLLFHYAVELAAAG